MPSKKIIERKSILRDENFALRYAHLGVIGVN